MFTMPTNKPDPATRIQKLVSQISATVREMSKQSAFDRKEARKPLVLRYQSWRGLLELERRTERAQRMLELSLKLAAAAAAAR